MRCLDCRDREMSEPVIGVCQSCGAAVCETHAHIGARRIRRGMLTGAPRETAVRTVRCTACAAVQAPIPGAPSA